jgi:hypothetical protein
VSLIFSGWECGGGEAGTHLRCFAELDGVVRGGRKEFLSGCGRVELAGWMARLNRLLKNSFSLAWFLVCWRIFARFAGLRVSD